MNDSVRSRSTDSESYLRLIKAGYWIGVIAFIASGLALVIEGESSMTLVLFTPVFLLILLLSYHGLGKTGRDERLAKIAGRAMTISWSMTLFIISILAVLNSTLHLLSLSATQVLGIMVLVMVSTMMVSNEVLRRKGDVD